jgi:hypothetical protein
MPRARRRRSRSAARRNYGKTALLLGFFGLVTVVVVGSLAEIHAQSGGYRKSTDSGYGQLAWVVAEASNQTGSQLAGLMSTAAGLPNQPVPETARTEIQQGLDDAVNSTAQQAARADGLVPPYPTANVSDRFSQVMADRAEATADLRTTIDQGLGMAPLPVAGAPSASTPSPAPLVPISQATAAMGAVGVLFERADRLYGDLLAYVHTQHLAIHLPQSVWVPPPVADAPLGPTQLAATASALSSSVPLVPFHQLVITAVGLEPPAVTTGGPGMVSNSCSAPTSTVRTSTPTVLPPTSSVGVAMTVTNCGTVVESGVVVTQVITLADPAGTAPPPPGARGGRAQTQVTLLSGSSAAVSLPTVSVASGHLYDLGLSIALPPSQAAHNPAGSSEQFLLQISS